MSLFDGFKKSRKEQDSINQKEHVSNNIITSNDIINYDDPEGYYFESAVELAIYGKFFSKGKKVTWLSGDNYWNIYKKAYQLFEQGEYVKAIDAYNDCLVLNPIGLSARFEICEAYLKIGNINAARRTLLEMKDFIIEDESIARFYRRMGFIEIERENYEVAAACYNYSKKYENHPSVSQELLYIRSRGGVRAISSNPISVLKKTDIPIITHDSIN